MCEAGRGSRRASRSRVTATPSCAARAATSSMASGSPSSRTHNSAVAAAVSAVRRNSGSRTRARSRNNATAGTVASSSGGGRCRVSGSASGWTGKVRSQRRRRASRLVTRRVSVGAATSSSPTGLAASRTCSKLSRTSRTRRPSMKSATALSGSLVPALEALNTRAIVGRTSAGSRAAERSTNPTASKPSPAWLRSRAVAVASRVFPTPPGPSSVRSRTSGVRSCSRMILNSSIRPSNGVGSDGGSSRAVGRPPSPGRHARFGHAWGPPRSAQSDRHPKGSGRPRARAPFGDRDAGARPFQAR